MSACFMCDKECELVVNDQFTSPICESCWDIHLMSLEQSKVVKELSLLRDRYLKKLTWKQFNEVHPSLVCVYCPSERKSTQELFYKIQDLAALNCAYAIALRQSVVFI